ncbi:MAG: hypothetical protein BGP16_12930 [Sphingobium sp. 66-54]|nr:MAG: hypothetical protein BGP16_12930 [Sphingobium sp. 66-54]
MLLTRFAPHLGVAAILVIAALSTGLALTRGKLVDARQDLRVEKALHETDTANFKAAQAKANADWQAEMARVQTVNRRLNDEADRRADAGRADYAARVMRLPAATADPGLSSDREMPGPGSAPSPDGPGGDSILLARADALICATNTARLQAAHEWALVLADQTKATR